MTKTPSKLFIIYSKLGEEFSLKDAYILHHNPIFGELVTSLYLHKDIYMYIHKRLNIQKIEKVSENPASLKLDEFFP